MLTHPVEGGVAPPPPAHYLMEGSYANAPIPSMYANHAMAHSRHMPWYGMAYAMAWHLPRRAMAYAMAYAMAFSLAFS